ncbi:hypothetical protein BH20ACT15_BH20ACT15_09500 [soil metagenome]
MEAIKEVGAFAGLAAFLGLAVLALLYFMQARDVRRLRENAEFLVEGDPMPTHPEDMEGDEDDEATQATAGRQPQAAARAAAAKAPSDAEAFRRAELARQAAERRQRFETRRRSEGGPRNLPELPSLAVMIVGAVILLAGIGFGASRLLGGEDGATSGGGGGNKAGLACPPGQTTVAVLNSTAETGLAAGFAQDLKSQDYTVGPVSNTSTPFDASTVMFAQGSEGCAPEIGPIVNITPSEPMSQEIREISEGADVSVVLGEDKASGATESSADGAASSDTPLGE